MGVTIGESDKHGRPGHFTLSDADRANHVYVIGQTGTGKTTLLRNAIVQDMERGRGVGLIDPHGDLAAAILDMVPPHRTNDVVYFNPADSDYPIGLNPIAKTSPHKHHLVILNSA